MRLYLANPAETIRMVRALSGEMDHYIDNVDREQAHAMGRLTGQHSLWATAQEAALRTVGVIQFHAVNMPTWIGGFNKGLAEGRSVEDSARLADSIVRLSQGTGHSKDLSQIQQKKGLTAVALMFTSYLLVAYNLTAQAGGDLKRLKPGAIARLAFISAVPAVLDALLRGEEPDEDKDEDAATWWALKLAKYNLAMIPILGRATVQALEGRPVDTMVAEAVGDRLVRGMKSALKAAQDDEDFTAEDFEKVVTGAGTALGLPGTTQISRILRAYNEEDASIQDYLIGPKKR
jgi:hypothetical protein